MEVLAKTDKSELAGSLCCQAHLAAKVGPRASPWDAIASVWLLLLRIHHLAAGGVPGATAGQQDRQLAGRAGYRAEEYEAELGPTQLLRVTVVPF